MAKGQMRSNKEKKKPKQNKAKKPAAAASSSAQMSELFHKVDQAKKPRGDKR